jgi:nucleoside-diphosphate-sugar epimerase
MAITCADIRRARETLGYNPVIPIRDGIRKFADWFLAQEAR